MSFFKPDGGKLACLVEGQFRTLSVGLTMCPLTNCMNSQDPATFEELANKQASQPVEFLLLILTTLFCLFANEASASKKIDPFMQLGSCCHWLTNTMMMIIAAGV